MDTESFSATVIVVGAGPVGLLTALYLAQAGIRVEILEKAGALSISPRAVGYYGGALLALKRAGILEKMHRAGFTSQGLGWRKPITDDGRGGKRMGDTIARLRLPKDDSTLDGLQTTIYLRQSELTKLLLQEVLETGLARVHYDAEVTGIEDNGDSVIATARKSDGTEYRFHGLFLVGADGGKSTTRKILGIPFKGHSWPERIVAMDILFEDIAIDYEFPTSLVVDPVHFGLITPLENPIEGKMTLYRCSVAVSPNDPRSDDELTSDSSVASLLHIMLPGPRPLSYKSVGSSAYRVHQLCATTFRRGRCILAGDAAHLNNVSPSMRICDQFCGTKNAEKNLAIRCYGSQHWSPRLRSSCRLPQIHYKRREALNRAGSIL